MEGKGTVVKSCMAPATLSHSGRSTFQFLKVDLSSTRQWEETSPRKKGRHQSDISLRFSRYCCFFSFFKVYVCHVHLWLKLCWRDHQRMIYLLYVFLCVTAIVLAKTAGYNIRYGSFIFIATHEIVFQRKSQLGLRCLCVCAL